MTMTTTTTAMADRPLAAGEPSANDLIAAAVALRPRLVDRQAEVEERTYFDEEMHEEFRQARLYDMYVPRQYGGLEVDVPTFTKVVIELARGCISTSWCFALSANHALQVASWFPKSVQDEVFGSGEFRCASVAAPTVTAERVSDGWRLNGTVGYCSGIPYSTYFLGQAMVHGSDGAPQMAMFIAPRSAFEILNDWGRTLGLKGTGSHSIRFTDAVIPLDYLQENSDMTNMPVEGGTVGGALHQNGMYSGRGLSVFTMSLAASVVGGAYNALDEYEHQMRIRKTALPPMVPRIEDADYQRWYGAAATKILTAEAALLQAAKMHMDYSEANHTGVRPYTFSDDFCVTGVAREAILQAWETVETDLFRTVGSSAAANGERFERVFRDLSQAAGHRNPALRDSGYRAVAQMLLGIAPSQP